MTEIRTETISGLELERKLFSELEVEQKKELFKNKNRIRTKIRSLELK